MQNVTTSASLNLRMDISYYDCRNPYNVKFWTIKLYFSEQIMQDKGV